MRGMIPDQRKNEQKKKNRWPLSYANEWTKIMVLSELIKKPFLTNYSLLILVYSRHGMRVTEWAGIPDTDLKCIVYET